jgi:hypothetical protein
MFNQADPINFPKRRIYYLFNSVIFIIQFMDKKNIMRI